MKEEIYTNPSAKMEARFDAAGVALNQDKYANGGRKVCDENIIDLITDLLHFAASAGMDTDNIIHMCQVYLEAEQNGEDEEE